MCTTSPEHDTRPLGRMNLWWSAGFVLTDTSRAASVSAQVKFTALDASRGLAPCMTVPWCLISGVDLFVEKCNAPGSRACRVGNPIKAACVGWLMMCFKIFGLAQTHLPVRRSFHHPPVTICLTRSIPAKVQEMSRLGANRLL